MKNTKETQTNQNLLSAPEALPLAGNRNRGQAAGLGLAPKGPVPPGVLRLLPGRSFAQTSTQGCRRALCRSSSELKGSHGDARDQTFLKRSAHTSYALLFGNSDTRGP